MKIYDLYYIMNTMNKFEGGVTVIGWRKRKLTEKLTSHES